MLPSFQLVRTADGNTFWLAGGHGMADVDVTEPQFETITAGFGASVLL